MNSISVHVMHPKTCIVMVRLRGGWVWQTLCGEVLTLSNKHMNLKQLKMDMK